MSGRPTLPGRATPSFQIAARDGLVDVGTVASYLSVSPDWIYEHADELRVRRLGTGPRPRLRFSLADVDEALTAPTCSAGRGSGELEASVDAPRRRRRPAAMGSEAPLLPIRSRRVA
jgi:hypothetical protein